MEFIIGRENKNEAVAALHKEQIMKASEILFSERGYSQTTIDDISKASGYSRRTIYAYYGSKEDILHHIIEKGLRTLKTDIEYAVNNNSDFVAGYKAVCMAMLKYRKEYPYATERVNSANAADIEFPKVSDILNRIMQLGTEINKILEAFIEKGKMNGVVRNTIATMPAVYVLWSSINALLSLADTKGQFICTQLSMSEEEFLDYGFNQIVNSILEVRV